MANPDNTEYFGNMKVTTSGKKKEIIDPLQVDQAAEGQNVKSELVKSLVTFSDETISDIRKKLGLENKELTSEDKFNEMRYILEHLTLVQESGGGRCVFKESSVTFDVGNIKSENLGLDEFDAEQLPTFLEGLNTFIHLSRIDDGFAHHADRRVWRDKMDAVFGDVFSDIYRENQYKWNKIAQLMDILGYLKQFGKMGDPSDPKLSKFLEITRKVIVDINLTLKPSKELISTMLREKQEFQKKQMEQYEKDLADGKDVKLPAPIKGLLGNPQERVYDDQTIEEKDSTLEKMTAYILEYFQSLEELSK